MLDNFSFLFREAQKDFNNMIGNEDNSRHNLSLNYKKIIVKQARGCKPSK